MYNESTIERKFIYLDLCVNPQLFIEMPNNIKELSGMQHSNIY